MYDDGRRTPIRAPDDDLELWTRPQPSAIRASDAVAWAHEVLQRYGHTGCKEGCPPCGGR
jgi:hypothetical protein